MKKVLSLIAIFILFVSTNTNAFTSNSTLVQETCFSMARNWVILTEGEINLDNVGFVLELTEKLSATGMCK